MGANCHPLYIDTKGGTQKISCANTEGILRVIQSIPSPKAEPFKRWLAKVGYERIQEIEDPELAQKRMKELYEQKGYPKDWIEKRLRGMAIRQDLTDEWKERGLTQHSDYAILTAEISKATFGMTPSEYRNHKNLPEKSKTNLRDHMTDLELIFTMLGEKVTTEISKSEKPEGLPENKNVANRGGKVAGNARLETVWLTQQQLAELFDKNIRTISEHINNLFKEGELEPDPVVRNFRTTASDGKTYNTNHYNLDVIISVGYRVKSRRGVEFRKWATQLLKKHLIHGYTLNNKMLAEQGITELKQSISLLQKTRLSNQLINDIAAETIQIVMSYAKTWHLLLAYDEDRLALPKRGHEAKTSLEYQDVKKAIEALKTDLI